MRPWALALASTIVLLVAAVALWGVTLGFRTVSPAAVEAVHVAANGVDLTVVYIGGAPGCGGDPYGVDVEESAEAVTLTGRVLQPVFVSGCSDDGHAMASTVRLSEPLGDRVVRDATRVWHDVRVVEGVHLGELFQN